VQLVVWVVQLVAWAVQLVVWVVQLVAWVAVGWELEPLVLMLVLVLVLVLCPRALLAPVSPPQLLLASCPSWTPPSPPLHPHPRSLRQARPSLQQRPWLLPSLSMPWCEHVLVTSDCVAVTQVIRCRG
jgi:hypothetical protein